jgi:molecular chaperone DnaK (HSP70)
VIARLAGAGGRLPAPAEGVKLRSDVNSCHTLRPVRKATKASGDSLPTIGIDLGTSNSAAAVLRGGRPVIIPSTEGITLGGKAFPSYVALTADGQMLIGEPARRQAAANPEGTATAFKRKMGQRVKLPLRNREFSP